MKLTESWIWISRKRYFWFSDLFSCTLLFFLDRWEYILCIMYISYIGLCLTFLVERKALQSKVYWISLLKIYSNWKLTLLKFIKRFININIKFSNIRKFEFFWNFHRSIKFWRSCLKKDVRICFPLLWQKKLRNFSELLYMILSKLRSPRSKSC